MLVPVPPGPRNRGQLSDATQYSATTTIARQKRHFEISCIPRGCICRSILSSAVWRPRRQPSFVTAAVKLQGLPQSSAGRCRRHSISRTRSFEAVTSSPLPGDCRAPTNAARSTCVHSCCRLFYLPANDPCRGLGCGTRTFLYHHKNSHNGKYLSPTPAVGGWRRCCFHDHC